MAVSENEIRLTPLAGNSGKAFIGRYASGEEIFVKMNTTPILAALAKEQIAPQLLWSKRMSNGDIMSAQELLSGRILKRGDMQSKQVITILQRLHRSKSIANQLVQLGYKIETPQDLLNSLHANSPKQILNNSYLQTVVRDLQQTLPAFQEDYATIVHGDVRHSNWIITMSGLIYLVDWDSVRLTDRMFDVAHILSHYLHPSRWHDWLRYYGYKDNEKVIRKIAWYGQFNYLNQIIKYYENNDMEHVNQEIFDLREFRRIFKRKSS